MISIKDQKMLIKLVKAIKSDIICIFPYGIIGSDKFRSTLSFINCATCVPGNASNHYEFTKESWKMFSDTFLGKEDIDEQQFTNILFQYSIPRIVPDSELMYKYKNISISLQNNPIIFYTADLKADPQFNEILAKKAAEGNSLYKVNENIGTISIYSGLLPINKNDKASLYIYDTSYANTFQMIAKFVIDKGFATVEKYIRYLGTN